MNIKQLVQSGSICCVTTAFVFLPPAILHGEQPSSNQAPQGYLRPLDATNGDLSESTAATAGEDPLIRQIEQHTSITAAQKMKMKEIVDAFAKRLEEVDAIAAPKRAPVVRSIVAARAAHNEGALAKALKDLDGINQPFNEACWTERTDLENVLTPAQRKEYLEGLTKWVIKRVATPVQLSDAQINRVMAVCPEVVKSTQGEFEQVVAKVVVGVLTTEQKEEVVKHHAEGYVNNVFGRAKLTVEQMKTVSAIVNELANDRRLDADWPYHSRMENELRKRINSVLTAEQRAIVEGRN